MGINYELSYIFSRKGNLKQILYEDEKRNLRIQGPLLERVLRKIRAPVPFSSQDFKKYFEGFERYFGIDENRRYIQEEIRKSLFNLR